MKMNAEDGGNRKFILCTNNENNICRDVTYERIKRVIDKEDYSASLKYFKVEYLPISERLYYIQQTSSYELQKNYYEEYVNAHERWTLVEIYADEGISGTSLILSNSFDKFLLSKIPHICCMWGIAIHTCLCKSKCNICADKIT